MQADGAFIAQTGDYIFIPVISSLLLINYIHFPHEPYPSSSERSFQLVR